MRRPLESGGYVLSVDASEASLLTPDERSAFAGELRVLEAPDLWVDVVRRADPSGPLAAFLSRLAERARWSLEAEVVDPIDPWGARVQLLLSNDAGAEVRLELHPDPALVASRVALLPSALAGVYRHVRAMTVGADRRGCLVPLDEMRSARDVLEELGLPVPASLDGGVCYWTVDGDWLGWVGDASFWVGLEWNTTRLGSLVSGPSVATERLLHCAAEGRALTCDDFP